jgi:hypothetical protein
MKRINVKTKNNLQYKKATPIGGFFITFNKIFHMKQAKYLTIFIIATFLISSCDNKKNDAKKLGELNCSIQKLVAQGKAGSPEYIKIADESNALSKEIEGKYKDPKDQNEIFEMLVKEAANCK